MKILVTGATGFIGSHLIKELVQQGYAPVAAGRDRARLDLLSDTYGIETVCFDINSPEKIDLLPLGNLDTVIHLAWGALDNYNCLSHIEKELPAHYNFLKTLILSGVKKVLVAGTCFEYGLQDGNLCEHQMVSPVTSYAIAKDSLRRYLSLLQKSQAFTLIWLRFFYLFGAGQEKQSLLSQLDSAIANGNPTFPMSPGEQLRDYLPVEDAARLTSLLITETEANGIFNICSGVPISIRKLAEKRVAQLGSQIKLDLGYYPYPKHEPMAFWGDRRKLNHRIDLKRNP